MPPVELRYAVADSPLGLVLLAGTGRGLCWLGLGDDEIALLAELARDYPRATPLPDAAALAPAASAVVAYLKGGGPCADLPLDLPGTPFQRRVWGALRAIPYGETRTYAQVAASLGLAPAFARAVGSAGAANRVSILVPCHRAVGGDGALRGFRWGLHRKAALIALEASPPRT